MSETNMRSHDAGKVMRILIVDDHPVVRQGLSDLFNQEEDMEVCGHAEGARHALEMMRKLDPDLITIDITLGDGNGLELIKDIKSQWPETQMLVISMHDEKLYAERALRAGAKGYIMKHEATDNVLDAVRKVYSGQVYVSGNMTEQMVRSFVRGNKGGQMSAVKSLSDRELEVFQLVGQGYGTRQIAERLHLSGKTIETYRSHIKQKLSMDSAADLLRYAVQWVNTQSEGEGNG
jgi:DNA-binding NarL/FixJ family response regulator